MAAGLVPAGADREGELGEEHRAPLQACRPVWRLSIEIYVYGVSSVGVWHALRFSL